MLAFRALHPWRPDDGPTSAQIQTEDSIALNELIRQLVARRAEDREDGQGLAEYALILALIAIVAILSLIFLGDSLVQLMSTINSAVDGAVN